MWLLKTSCAELQYFNDPPEKYAILSHVWEQGEQSFQDVQDLHVLTVSEELSPIDNPRSLLSQKIRNCCIYAESQGYEWLWVDTCCIDKTSSAELSEAINSMYHWYARATVCYVYLQDVSSDEDPSCEGSLFRSSKWFTRGWTLQELIAPKRVHFLSQDWVQLGTKALFARLLEQITGIDVDVLTFRSPLSSVSVAKRMWWASRRTTTRVEDEAYSLMGIFDVHMATIYGEGRQAFRRLQKEIMKNVSDHTLFTWGVGHEGASLVDSYLYMPVGSHNLLATSPSDFRDRSVDVLTTPIQEFWDALEHLPGGFLNGDSKFVQGTSKDRRHTRNNSMDRSDSSLFDIPELTMTSHGIRARLPIIDLPRRPHGPEGQPTRSVALLACTTRGASTLVGLLLYRSQGSPLYGAGYTLIDGLARWTFFGPSSGFLFHATTVGQPLYQWKTIYITQDRSGSCALLPTPIPTPTRAPTPRCSRKVQVFIPCWVTARLARSDFTLKMEPEEECGYGEQGAVHNMMSLVPGATLSYKFYNAATQEQLAIHVGRCADDSESGEPRLWLTVELLLPDESCVFGTEPLHRASSPDSTCEPCTKVHLHQWSSIKTEAPERERLHRLFGDTHRSVQLYMTHWGSGNESEGEDEGDEQTWEINVELSGQFYGSLPRTSSLLHALRLQPESGMLSLFTAPAYPSPTSPTRRNTEQSIEVRHRW